MLHCAVAFFAVGLIAAFSGFGGFAVASVGLAEGLFVMFAVLSVAGYLLRLFRGVPTGRQLEYPPHLQKE